MNIISSTKGTQMSYQYITPRINQIVQCIGYLDIPLEEERSRSGKIRKYRKTIGKERPYVD